MRALRLPFRFDPARLASELARVEPGEWIEHVNRHDYAGRWSGAALRSVGGDPAHLIPDAAESAVWADTPLLGRCDAFREVFDTFRCPLRSVRLLNLHAGSHIAEHVDGATEFEQGEVRLHVPVTTNDAVAFHVDGARIVMAPGECWYVNVNLPHRVDNDGSTDRVHLVLDCRVNAWLEDVFARTPVPPPDDYRATVRTTTPPRTTAWIELFSRAAAELSTGPHPVRFLARSSTLVLEWREPHAWQLRLRHGDDGVARLESSPDPSGRHRTDYARVLERTRRALPDAKVVEEGLR